MSLPILAILWFCYGVAILRANVRFVVGDLNSGAGLRCNQVEAEAEASEE